MAQSPSHRRRRAREAEDGGRREGEQPRDAARRRRISPLLANAYLHLLDRIWERHRLKEKLGAHLVRYADDFVVLCRKGVEEPLKVVRHVWIVFGLTLNEPSPCRGCQRSRGSTSGFHDPDEPERRRASYARMCARRTRPGEDQGKTDGPDTERELTCIPLGDVVRNVNRS